MQLSGLILLIYFIAPAVLGALIRTATINGIISYSPKLKFSLRNDKFERGDYLSWAVFSIISLTILLGFLVKIKIPVPNLIWYSLLACLYTTTLMLGSNAYGLPKLIVKHSTIFKMLLGFIAIFMGAIASTFVDSYISNYTNINPVEFPAAQKLLFFAISIPIWSLLFIAFGMIAYIFVALHFLSEIFQESNSKQKQQFKSKYKIRKPYYKSAKSTDRTQARIRLLALFVGTAYAVGFSFVIFNKLFAGVAFDKAIREIFVFSSFHLPPATCQINNSPKGTLISLIKYHRASVATPDKILGYRFSISSCIIKPDN